jgi:hypothetical protein
MRTSIRPPNPYKKDGAWPLVIVNREDTLRADVSYSESVETSPSIVYLKVSSSDIGLSIEERPVWVRRCDLAVFAEIDGELLGFSQDKFNFIPMQTQPDVDAGEG